MAYTVLPDNAPGAIVSQDIALMERFLRMLSSAKDTDTLGQEGIQKLIKHVHGICGILLINDPDKQMLNVQNIFVNIDNLGYEKKLSKALQEYMCEYNDCGAALKTCSTKQKVVKKKTLHEITESVLPKSFSTIIEKKGDVQSAIAIPVVVRNELIGVLVCAFTAPRIEKVLQDRLQLFGDIIGVALKNAQLVAGLETNITELSHKRRDLSSLIDLSKIGASSLHIQKVLQSLMDSVPKKLRHLKYTSGTLVLYDAQINALRAYAITKSETTQKSIEILDQQFKEYELKLDTKKQNNLVKSYLTSEVIVGDSFEDFVAPPVGKRTAKKIQETTGSRVFVSLPVTSKGKNIGALLFVSKRPKSSITDRDVTLLTAFSNHLGIIVENTKLYGTVQRQLDELKSTNAELQEANEQLRLLDDAKSEFISIASHQLRTPLTSIKGYLSMILDGFFGVVPNEEMKKKLQDVYASSNRLIDLVNNLLNVSHIEKRELNFACKEIKLKTVIKDIVNEVKPMAQSKGLQIWLKTGRQDLTILGDESKLASALSNIVDNAIKYTNKGSIAVSLQKKGSNARISIKDTGRGLSKKDRENLFSKFRRGDGAFTIHTEGLGLGLYVTKKILDVHNASISVHSEGPSKGTEFEIDIPLK